TDWKRSSRPPEPKAAGCSKPYCKKPWSRPPESVPFEPGHGDSGEKTTPVIRLARQVYLVARRRGGKMECTSEPPPAGSKRPRRPITRGDAPRGGGQA